MELVDPISLVHEHGVRPGRHRHGRRDVEPPAGVDRPHAEGIGDGDTAEALRPEQLVGTRLQAGGQVTPRVCVGDMADHGRLRSVVDQRPEGHQVLRDQLRQGRVVDGTAQVRVAIAAVAREVLGGHGDPFRPQALGERGRGQGHGVGVLTEGAVPDHAGSWAAVEVDDRREHPVDVHRRRQLAQLLPGDERRLRTALAEPTSRDDRLAQLAHRRHAPALIVDRHQKVFAEPGPQAGDQIPCLSLADDVLVAEHDAAHAGRRQAVHKRIVGIGHSRQSHDEHQPGPLFERGA